MATPQSMLFRETPATRKTVAPAPSVPLADWRTGLPQLHVEQATVRELRLSDAPALLSALSTEQVTRFISPPPTTVEGFERFISWTAGEQAAGRYICFAIVPDGRDNAAGIIQIRQLDAAFHVGEWGFAIDSAYWGTGLFQSAARAVIAFAFDEVGVHRLEARAAAANARGNAALRKLGAINEGVLRRSFLKDGTYHDQILWGIVSSEWATEAHFPLLH